MVNLIYSGRGILVPVIAFGSCLGMDLTTRAVFQDDTYYQEHCWPMPLALAIAGVACVVVSQIFSGGEPRTLIDVETREAGCLASVAGHVFFVPVRYWGPILFVCRGCCGDLSGRSWENMRQERHRRRVFICQPLSEQNDLWNRRNEWPTFYEKLQSFASGQNCARRIRANGNATIRTGRRSIWRCWNSLWHVPLRVGQTTRRRRSYMLSLGITNRSILQAR